MERSVIRGHPDRSFRVIAWLLDLAIQILPMLLRMWGKDGWIEGRCAGVSGLRFAPSGLGIRYGLHLQAALLAGENDDVVIDGVGEADLRLGPSRGEDQVPPEKSSRSRNMGRSAVGTGPREVSRPTSSLSMAKPSSRACSHFAHSVSAWA
jgi:hypothetical protein